MTILFQTVLPLQKAALLDDYSIPDCPSTAESSPLR